MRKLTAYISSFLLAFACEVSAQEVSAEETPVAASLVEEAAVEEAPVAEPAPAENVEVSTPAEITEVSAPAEQRPEVNRLDTALVVRLLNSGKKPYPRYLPAGLFVRSSYGPSNGVDFGIGFMFPLSRSWPVSVGFEPFHLQIAADNFQVVSDETIWIAAAGAIMGGLGPIFRGPDFHKDSVKTSEKTSMGPVGSVLAAIALVPVYALCGSLYIPVVPGSWLGILDRSRLNTQIISEGFHKRSFTYMNDVGLRLSPLASSDGVVHGFADGGIRFEKNFAADMKYHYFAQLGISLSFF